MAEDDFDELVRTTIPYRIGHSVSGGPDGQLVLEVRFAWSPASYRSGLVGKATVAMSPQEAAELAKDVTDVAMMLAQAHTKSGETH